MIKRLLKIALAIVAVLVLVIVGTIVYIDRSEIPSYPPGNVQLKVEVTPERVERGARTMQLLCAGCHLDNETGTLAGKPMEDLPAQFGWAHSANITRDPETGIGTWTDGELVYLLRTGVRRDGRYTPPWMVKLAKMSDEDVLDIIAFLRSDDPLVRPVKAKRPASKPSLLTKALSRVAFKPLPYPTARSWLPILPTRSSTAATSYRPAPCAFRVTPPTSPRSMTSCPSGRRGTWAAGTPCPT